ncbi:amidohydrolase family protein [Neobacillus niacini]|uniref:amidohydrolase family protein n=1 Tax=Neobacillus niacini TaxID=86668 RepID=UPI0030035E82
MSNNNNNFPVIDTHQHIVSPPVKRKMDELNLTGPKVEWSPEIAIERNENAGISFAFLSYPSAPAFVEQAESTKLVRETNEYLAKLVGDHPTKFGAFATLPMPSVENSLEEVIYSLDTLRLDGVAFLSSYKGKYLSHPDNKELLNELDCRHATVLVHPILIKEELAGLPPAMLEGTFDTTRNVTSMAVNQIFDKFPNINFIFPHTGGMVPYIKWRIAVTALAARTTTAGDFLQVEVSPEEIQTEMAKLDRLYYDTAVNPGPLPKLMNPSQILFGTDIPFANDNIVQYQLNSIFNHTEELGEEMVRAITSGNALRLFPRLKEIMGSSLVL